MKTEINHNQAMELKEALCLVLKEIEYCVEDGTLPMEAVNNNPSIILARKIISDINNKP
jgi:hypothetical protein